MPSTLSRTPLPRTAMPWVVTSKGHPYFQTEDGQPWHPIGQNDAISWAELSPLFARKDLAAVESYLKLLADHGVTVMRLMLEYAQVEHRYFETRPGKWSRNVVQFWDDLFALCEMYGIRLLLTPFDTFWMWLRFKHHPYNRKRGGILQHPSKLLLCRDTRDAIKHRLAFAADRWGGSGALFAWDLWNEIHPAQAEMNAEPFLEFIEDLSTHLRAVETARYGRAHPQTVSLFGPELRWRPRLKMEGAIFRHPSLDFATIHIYEEGTIDHPKNTVDAAISMGRVVKESLAEIIDERPFFDSEHGPIHTFKDFHRTLPEPFDDEYFRHMQWAHLASGGTGGGMRWPNRRVHSLTPGMRIAQRGLARFLTLIDWKSFSRVNVSDRLQLCDSAGREIGPESIARFGCATQNQALVYLLRRDTLLKSGRTASRGAPVAVRVRVPTLFPGCYNVDSWDTRLGQSAGSGRQRLDPAQEIELPPFSSDIAVAIRQII